MKKSIRAGPLAGSSWLVRRATFVGLFLVLLGTAAVRLRLIHLPLERDEGEYAYIGAQLLEGVPPFASAYTMKLPGTPVMYALSMAAFGRSIVGIRLGLLLVNGATTLLLFFLARRVLLGNTGALVTALSFSCFSLSTALLAIYAHATHFVLLFAIGGLLLLLLAIDSSRPIHMILSGVLFGIAIFMKQPGAVFAGFAYYWIIYTSCRTSSRRIRMLIRNTLLFTAGLGGITLALLGAIWASGTLVDLYFWSVIYARLYSNYSTIADGVDRLLRQLAMISPHLWAFGILAMGGLLAVIVSRAHHRARAFIVGLLIFSFAGVSAGFYFRPHYFILFLPAMALLVGFAGEAPLRYLPTANTRQTMKLAILSIVAVASALSILSSRRILFESTPAEVSRALYFASPFPEAIEVARYIQDHTSPSESIAILGSEPEILFYAGRRSATRHIYVYWLMEPHLYARSMQLQMTQEIERSRPAFIVWVRTESSWDRNVYSDRLIFEWMRLFLAARYIRVGQVEIRGPNSTTFLWDSAVMNAPVTPNTHIIIFRKNDLMR